MYSYLVILFSFFLIVPSTTTAKQLPRNKKRPVEQFDTFKRTATASFLIGFGANCNRSNSPVPALTGAALTASADVAYSKISGDNNYPVQVVSCTFGYLSGLVTAQALMAFISYLNPQRPNSKR